MATPDSAMHSTANHQNSCSTSSSGCPLASIAALRAEFADRIIYSTDFKRRPHYNQFVGMTNAEIQARIDTINAQIEALLKSEAAAESQ